MQTCGVENGKEDHVVGGEFLRVLKVGKLAHCGDPERRGRVPKPEDICGEVHRDKPDRLASFRYPAKKRANYRRKRPRELLGQPRTLGDAHYAAPKAHYSAKRDHQLHRLARLGNYTLGKLGHFSV